MSHTSAATANWSLRAKLIVSGLVVFQLLAIVAEPFRFFSSSVPRGTSQAARPIRWLLGPYVEFAYLNHGYFFFAPEPGPSHLMQCSLSMPDGKTPIIRYPDKYAQWPRLLYHRHFMLSEFLHQLYVPPIDDVALKQLSTEETLDWKERRRVYDMVRQSMENHLKVRYGANAVSIARMEHILPGSEEVLEQHLPLNDPRFYVILPDSLPPREPSATATPLPPMAFPPRRGGEKVEVSP